MKWRRTILRLAAYLAGLHAGTQLRAFLTTHRRTPQVQDLLLRELLERHADTAFGSDHGFSKIRSYEEFVRAVPIGSYETHRPYVERVLAGETTALLPPDEQPLMFSMTSGTTGRPKHIPATQRFSSVMKRCWNMFGLKTLRDHPDGWLRSIITIASPMRETSSPTGLPCGAISGLLTSQQKKIVRTMYVVPPEVAAIADPQAKFYSILRCGIGRDVAIITTANPSSTIKLIETGQANAERLIRDVADGTLTPPGQIDPSVRRSLRFSPNRPLASRLEQGLRRDGELRPRHFWNLAFLTNWTGGTLQLYLPRLRALFDNVPIRDIGLLASEGRFSIPLEDDTPAGVAEITGNFLEFIPADQRDSTNPQPLRAHELEIGQEYFLVFSNWTGLWRYNLDDRIRVVDHYEQSPVFEFLSRGPHTANITGEKLTEHQVVEAARRASRRAEVACERFVLQGCFAHTPYYELRLEAGDGRVADKLAEWMDKSLCELNMEYQGKRHTGRLGAVRATVLPPGELERTEQQTIRQRHGRSEQYKHQYLLTDVITKEQ